MGAPGKDGAPSQDVINTWSDGGSNLEPSAKMLQLVAFLQEWECTGDKVICFSQCAPVVHASCEVGKR